MKTTPFLGEPASFREAFPTIDEWEIRVEQDPYGHYTSQDHRRLSVFATGNPPPRPIPCINPRCRQGGLDLNAYLIAAASSGGMDETVDFPCNGHEGSPKGRRRGNPCDNRFKTIIKVRCKQSE